MKLFHLIFSFCLLAPNAQGQNFMLQQCNDSLSLLMLRSDEGGDVWRLPYPTFAFATGDVNGDGQTEALVGVVKPTRYDPRMARRLFVFKNVHGRVRPLWLGTRLGGELHDFRFQDGHVITLEQERDSTWFVGRYRWDSFGFVMTSAPIRHTTYEQARQIFSAALFAFCPSISFFTLHQNTCPLSSNP